MTAIIDDEQGRAAGAHELLRDLGDTRVRCHCQRLRVVFGLQHRADQLIVGAAPVVSNWLGIASRSLAGRRRRP